MARFTQMMQVMAYFEANPRRWIETFEVVDFVVDAWEKRMKKKFRDPDRMIRALHSQGILQKGDTGLYMYDPDDVQKKELDDFTSKQKAEIMKKGRYRCAICGKGEADGVKLHVDHMKPRYLGGKSSIKNGQVLCAAHNYRKRTYDQTETGKQMFINLREAAKENGDRPLLEFCDAILQVYEDHDVNGHIEWSPVE